MGFFWCRKIEKHRQTMFMRVGDAGRCLHAVFCLLFLMLGFNGVAAKHVLGAFDLASSPLFRILYRLRLDGLLHTYTYLTIYARK